MLDFRWLIPSSHQPHQLIGKTRRPGQRTLIPMNRVEVVGIVYNPRTPEAEAMSVTLVKRLNLEERSWVCSAAAVDPNMPEAKDTDLVITVGGDGTIIRAAKLSVLHGIPILGINMGRLGFMTELEAGEALDKVPLYLEGTARLEERGMLQVSVVPGEIQNGGNSGQSPETSPCHALNDAVVGRGAMSRVISIGASIDGAYLTEFRADAVMVSTSTGSTGYNLSVGGPILSPEASEMILKSVAPHVGMAPALVLPSTSVVDLTVDTDQQVMLSVDGYMDMELHPGDGVRVQKSPYRALFLRADPPAHYYATLTRRLGFGGGQSSTRAIQY